MSVNDTSEPIISFSNVSKDFIDGDSKLSVLSDITFSLMPGQQISIVGKSGSGKSTLLQLMGGLDGPSSGTITLMGRNYQDMNESELDKARNQVLGFVYQQHHLLPEFNAKENVMMPLLVKGESISKALSQAELLLDKVGLSDRKDHLPAKLSGGEKQRVAIARALVCNPKCIFADEPTGNLDPDTGKSVVETIRTVNPKVSVVVVTHDLSLAKQFDMVYEIKGGKISVV